MLYYLAALEPPFSGENLISLGYNIVNRIPKSIPSIYSEDLNKFIMTLLEKDSERRKPLSYIIGLIPNGKKIERKTELKNEAHNLINEELSKEKIELQIKEKNQNNFFGGKKEIIQKIIEKNEENEMKDPKKEIIELANQNKNNFPIAEIIPTRHSNLDSVRVTSPIMVKKDGFFIDEKKDTENIKTAENKSEIVSKQEKEKISKPFEMNENHAFEKQIEQNEKKIANSSNLQKFKIRPFSANVAVSKPKDDKKGEGI